MVNSNGTTILTGTIPGSSTWFNVAFCRTGTTYYLFINGVLQQSPTTASAMNPGANPLYIGWTGYSSDTKLSGAYIDELRISSGINYYTSAYTPATAAFTQ
jgi:hypothetical protein